MADRGVQAKSPREEDDADNAGRYADSPADPYSAAEVMGRAAGSREASAEPVSTKSRCLSQDPTTRAALRRCPGSRGQPGRPTAWCWHSPVGQAGGFASAFAAITLPDSRAFGGYPSVGKLFFDSQIGQMSCTAEVINSPNPPKGGSGLILTAAHCVAGVVAGEPYADKNFVFAPLLNQPDVRLRDNDRQPTESPRRRLRHWFRRRDVERPVQAQECTHNWLR